MSMVFLRYGYLHLEKVSGRSNMMYGIPTYIDLNPCFLQAAKEAPPLECSHSIGAKTPSQSGRMEA
ncbi:hypothetical protein Dda_3231 [Drechslerella dactyloides]|uniref:Uncharacterized protein n=1 Tax=Drechslerella dactyloides TaxID=74499 RepID=A0AAD6J0Y4_DREDA|nr:hypothetical protein Dda_3231 [Drechslerella dactyloides]